MGRFLAFLRKTAAAHRHKENDANHKLPQGVVFGPILFLQSAMRVQRRAVSCLGRFPALPRKNNADHGLPQGVVFGPVLFFSRLRQCKAGSELCLSRFPALPRIKTLDHRLPHGSVFGPVLFLTQIVQTVTLKLRRAASCAWAWLCARTP